ncbi:sigma-70 family RNA polymerase sigma factor [Streptomonospora litoralis]|uniref:RNA polymerase sigma factor n=1 Tax=Streptomonospora litoralis TaxID=2498135 RepID=A0A4P6Q8K3_9ACTN|nr:sigma-70 family RNA polymerase sigma factor [Streptomonospora litoralis]QBI55559.1 ECF RNA polymerase sigma factor SigC [Streptomonospora litoralis]
MQDADLTRLALAAGAGAPGAADRLVGELRSDVTRFIASMAEPGWVEELTQETLIRALRGLPRFAARSSARSWLLTIARHTVADRYRAAASRPATVSVDDCERAQTRTGAAHGRFEEEVALLNLLASLPEPRRTAFVLTRIEGFAYTEAAEMTGVPVGTVRSRVARARSDLADALRLAEDPAAPAEPAEPAESVAGAGRTTRTA